jgi:hypothetical protein
MQDLKMSQAKDQASQSSTHREPYKAPTVTVIHLKMEERLLACDKDPARACNGGDLAGGNPNKS